MASPATSSWLSQSIELSYKQLEKKIKEAKQEKKIFIVYDGYGPLRQALLRRGWLEKVPPGRIQFMNTSTDNYIIANMLKYSPFHFIWQPKSRPVKIPGGVDPPTFVNSVYRRRDLDFTSKEGLINLKNNMNWYTIENVSDLAVPRTYVLSDRDGRQNFIQDFKRTNFIGFVLYLAKKKNFRKLFTDADDGISTNIIDLSIAKVEVLLRIRNHEDIDCNYLVETFARFPVGRDVKETNMRKIITKSKKFKIQTEAKIAELLNSVRNCADKILEHWPDRNYDGFRNLWVVKPIGSSSGYGVEVLADERIILKTAMNGNSRFIVQKYIERPMLIQSRKFDIRIYFMTLIRDGFVDLWMYKNCYFKFGTHKFNLDSLDKSIHITNYAVQKHFMNSDDAVTNSVENMWLLKEFLRHLEYIEKPNLWHEKIYPAIKQNIVAVLMQNLEVTKMEVNNFELNGADFMLTYDHSPVLLEINSKPALFFSPSVVDLITGQLQEDIVKVLVDFQRDITSPTGDFELAHIYEIPQTAYPSSSNNLTMQKSQQLAICGTKLHLGASKKFSRKSRVRTSVTSNSTSEENYWIAPTALITTSNQMLGILSEKLKE